MCLRSHVKKDSEIFPRLAEEKLLAAKAKPIGSDEMQMRAGVRVSNVSEHYVSRNRNSIHAEGSKRRFSGNYSNEQAKNIRELDKRRLAMGPKEPVPPPPTCREEAQTKPDEY